jgi:glutamate dehydrogenase (NAD(P)+)
VVVQGLGNVGFHAARILRDNGAIITAIAEYEGAIHNPKGLDPEDLAAHRKSGASILDYPKGEPIADSHHALELECDILIPAALENQINAENADRIHAKIVAEAANGPVTPDAEKVLRDKGVLILPDLFLNAGGVTVSYFEWLKNLSHVRFGRMAKRREVMVFSTLVSAIEQATGKPLDPAAKRVITHGADEVDLVNSGLEETMVQAYREIREKKKANDAIEDLRTAAFVLAIDKIAHAYMAAGIFP